AAFWFILLRQSAPAGVVRPLLFADLTLAVVLLLLLNSALQPEDRISLPGMGYALGAFIDWLKRCWQSPFVKASLAVVVIVGAIAGFVLWYYLMRAEPDFEGANAEEHFKHAPIGLSTESRLPYYIWQVLPTMFPEKMPRAGGWASFGFIFEPGQDL